ncbi:MAG: UrcA family protein [Proteobacteria bacterium]|nr:UrcA family protein [Pseudomonadota bacterium]
MSHRPLSTLVAATLIAGAILTVAIAPAIASPAESGPAVAVHYADLDLSRGEGIATLYRRLGDAAAEVCGPPTWTGTHIVSQEYKDCVSDAVHRAVLHVHDSALTAYHRSKTVPRAFIPGA